MARTAVTFHRALPEERVTEARNDGSDEEDLTGTADGLSDPSEETYGFGRLNRPTACFRPAEGGSPPC